MNPAEAAALDFLREHKDWSVLLDENGGFLGLAAPGCQKYWEAYWEWYWKNVNDPDV